MRKTQKTGKLGEHIASNYLTSLGYQLLEKNWRHRKAEIDLILKDSDNLVFVEVKTRSSDHQGEPASFVSQRQQQLIFTAANAYMECINHSWEIRFDIIGITLWSEHRFDLKHYQDVFY